MSEVEDEKLKALITGALVQFQAQLPVFTDTSTLTSIVEVKERMNALTDLVKTNHESNKVYQSEVRETLSRQDAALEGISQRVAAVEVVTSVLDDAQKVRKEAKTDASTNRKFYLTTLIGCFTFVVATLLGFIYFLASQAHNVPKK